MVAEAAEIARLPCTARELETALHAVCDHGGLWDAEVDFALGGCLVLATKDRRTGDETTDSGGAE